MKNFRIDKWIQFIDSFIYNLIQLDLETFNDFNNTFTIDVLKVLIKF